MRFESAEKKERNVHFAPKDIIIKMSHLKEFEEEVWQEFLKTKPSNQDLCLAICRAKVVKEKAWEEVLNRQPTKEDFIFLFEHLRDSRLLNYQVWEIFKKRDDLERKDFEKVLESKKIDTVTAREAKAIMRRYSALEVKELELKEEDPNNQEKGLSQQRNDFVVKKKKRLIKPWEHDNRDPMHS